MAIVTHVLQSTQNLLKLPPQDGSFAALIGDNKQIIEVSSNDSVDVSHLLRTYPF
jgi:hypothetical protein